MNTLSHSEVNNKGTAFSVSLSIRCLLNLTISSAEVSSFLSTSSFVLLEQRGLHVYHELTVCVYVTDHSSTVLLVKLFGQLSKPIQFSLLTSGRHSTPSPIIYTWIVSYLEDRVNL